MPSSSTSTFGELDEFEAALRTQTDVDLLVTEQGRFRGRLTQVALHQVHLVAADETVPRIAFISIRRDLTLAWWALGRHGSQIWCGTPSLADEIVTFGPGARVHARTQSDCRWAGLWISTADLDRHWRAITGTPVIPLSGARSWRPSDAALRTLRALHAAAIRLFENRASEVLTASAVDGLEQQLIHALVECLSDGAPGAQNNRTRRRHNSLMACFEAACMSYEHRIPSLKELCTALDVPERTLRASCVQHLGMGPMRYLRLRKMKLVRHALRSARPADSGVAELARRYGFIDMGRFAGTYRQLFGELPSATLQRIEALLWMDRCHHRLRDQTKQGRLMQHRLAARVTSEFD
jgi:AraC-like DNA-binding protein